MRGRIRKVGKRGQVTVPKKFRTALRLLPGSEVTFFVERNRLVLRPSREKTSVAFERIAKRRNKPLKFHPHDAYEDELKERLG